MAGRGTVGRPKDTPELRAFKVACRQCAAEGVRQMQELLEGRKLKPREVIEVTKFAAGYGHGTTLPMGASPDDPMAPIADLPPTTQLSLLKEQAMAYAEAIRLLKDRMANGSAN